MAQEPNRKPEPLKPFFQRSLGVLIVLPCPSFPCFSWNKARKTTKKQGFSIPAKPLKPQENLADVSSILAKEPPEFFAMIKAGELTLKCLKGVVHGLSKPKRTAKFTPPPGLHWPHCSSSLLQGFCAECGVRHTLIFFFFFFFFFFFLFCVVFFLQKCNARRGKTKTSQANPQNPWERREEHNKIKQGIPWQCQSKKREKQGLPPKVKIRVGPVGFLELRWPGDSQSESGRFVRVDSQKNPLFS